MTRVVLDTSVLVLLLDPNAAAPLDPTTGKPLDRAQERVNLLVATLSKSKTKVLVPTPVLAEVLAKAGSAGPVYFQIIDGASSMEFAGFNTREAIELVQLETQYWGTTKPTVHDTRQKVKVDRQIVAISKTNLATTIYSDDHHMKSLAVPLGIQVVRSFELPLPPTPAQGLLPL